MRIGAHDRSMNDVRYACIGLDASHAAIRALVKKSLPSIQWRHHGIGVLQGYVAENTEPEIRVHIWAPELVKSGMPDSGDVHNHRFDMISHVLAGVVGHEEWYPEESESGEYTTMRLTHARAAADTNFHGPTTPTGERLKVRRNMMTIPAGRFYTFPAGIFHRSPLICPLTVTCVEKHRQRDYPAQILYPMAIPPVMAFGHAVDSAMVERIVSAAYDVL